MSRATIQHDTSPADVQHGSTTEQSTTETRFGCKITIKPYRLTRQTRADIERSLKDIADYPGAHTHFDVCDRNGEVAAVYLFLKDGQLHARGDRYTSVLRDPADVWRFLQRSKRVREITFITDRRVAE